MPRATRTVTDSPYRRIGCSAIDTLLGGGLDPGTVTQFYGEAGSGKTNVALSACVHASIDGGRSLYIDAEGISSSRLEQIIPQEHDDDIITDRIIVREVFDFAEQTQAIKEAESVASDLDVIAVDSITGFYRLERGSESEEGDTLRAVANQVTHLLSIARKFDIAVLVTNQVFTDPETDRLQPLGGQTLRHWSGTIVRLERFRGGNRRATLEKHRSLPAGGTATFRITETGLDSVDSFS